ncbi:hypothetical protein RhiirA4_464808 [Rhizophagus irregularis]|uniref:Uncharacterized protein n=1 Tax=Rhizophagus irregularis TaxID=588596 RepID=A0A2I1GQU4_9GLOM|nr:hypothetical protein RhiirA4_464808 [Rhizophagus irregularis]
MKRTIVVVGAVGIGVSAAGIGVLVVAAVVVAAIVAALERLTSTEASCIIEIVGDDILEDIRQEAQRGMLDIT